MEDLAQELEITTKSKIVSYIKQFGEATVPMLAEFLKLSHMAVRKHLNSLTIQEILTTRTISKRVGRPQIAYLINTTDVQDSALAVELLDSIKENLGESVVIDLMAKRTNNFYEKYKNRFENKTIKEKALEASRVFNENGFETEIEEVLEFKKIILKYKYCPYLNVAVKHPSLCIFEIETLEKFIGVKVNRICHLCSGGESCSYEFFVS